MISVFPHADHKIENFDNQKIWSGNLDYISFGFSTTNAVNQSLNNIRRKVRHGMAFTLSPYTNVGYEAVDSLSLIDNNTPIVNKFQGKGSSYRFLLSNGFLYKNFSFGMNIGYLFGSLDQREEVSFTNLEFAFADILDRDFNLRAFIWDVGIQYKLDLDKADKESDDYNPINAKYIIFGLYGNSGPKVTTFTNDSDEEDRLI